MSADQDIENMPILERLRDARAKMLTEGEQTKLDAALAPTARRVSSTMNLAKHSNFHNNILRMSDPLGLKNRPLITQLALGTAFKPPAMTNILANTFRPDQTLPQLTFFKRRQGGALGLMMGESMSKQIPALASFNVHSDLRTVTGAFSAGLASVARPRPIITERFVRGMVGADLSRSLITTVGLTAKMNAQQEQLRTLFKPQFDRIGLAAQLREIGTVSIPPHAFAMAIGATRFALPEEHDEQAVDDIEASTVEGVSIVEAGAAFGFDEQLMRQVLAGDLDAIGRVAAPLYVRGGRALERGDEASFVTFDRAMAILTLVVAIAGTTFTGLSYYAPRQAEVQSPAAEPPDLVDDLERLTRLRRSGALTPHEFAEAKQDVLAEAAAGSEP